MTLPVPQRFVVVHETKYQYEAPVGLSRQIVHLAPRHTPWQSCESHSLRVSPQPDILDVTPDVFGNPRTSLCIDADHDALDVRSESWVTVSDRGYPSDAETMPWEAVRARLAYRAGTKLAPNDLDATHFLFESTRVRNKRELAAWAMASFPKGAPLLVGVRALMKRIHDTFTFDPTATTVSTPVMKVFEQKRGVCQDFAHLMLSCLRSIGLSARYVSGYILTKPPPGKKRLVGADASHAWVSVYLPDWGWVDADPTNDVFPSTEHVTLAWGRDYDDVVPLRGVILGGGAQELEIKVTVVPAADYGDVFGRG